MNFPFRPSKIVQERMDVILNSNERLRGFSLIAIGVVLMNLKTFTLTFIYLLSFISDLNLYPEAVRIFSGLKNIQSTLWNTRSENYFLLSMGNEQQHMSIIDVLSIVMFIVCVLCGLFSFCLGIITLIQLDDNVKLNSEVKMTHGVKFSTAKSQPIIVQSKVDAKSKGYLDELNKQKMFLSTPEPRIKKQKTDFFSDSRLLSTRNFVSYTNATQRKLLFTPSDSSILQKDDKVVDKRMSKETKNLEDSDEAAYILLESLEVSWLSTSATVNVYIDDWTEKIKRFLRNYMLDVLKKFEKNCNAILACLTKSEFSFVGTEEYLISLLNFSSEESSQWQESELEKIVQKCQLLVLSTNQFKDHFNNLKRLYLERKRLEKYFRVIGRGWDPDRVKFYVLKRMENIVNSGSNIPGFHWNNGSESYHPHSFPTDAEILLNIVCVWFDAIFHTTFTKDEFGREESSFLNLHCKDLLTCKIDELKRKGFWGFLIETPIQKPENTHIKLMIGGNIWEIRHGRLNVFHAIILLMYSLVLRKVEGFEQVLDFLK